MAFNAKNLEYNKQEPSFLRRLRGEVGGLDGRHNVQIARPKKDRLKTGDDEEDEPVILDERGERIEKAELERRMKGEEDGELPAENEEAGARATQAEAKQNSERSARQMVTEVGSSANAKKRKAGKVVGGENEDDGNVVDKAPKQRNDPKEDENHLATKNGPVILKKKGKKIKLSFDDPDG